MRFFKTVLLIPVSLLFVAGVCCSHAGQLDKDTIRQQLIKSADWHLENPYDTVGLNWWHMAPYYDGLYTLAQATGDARYLAEIIRLGEQVAWYPAHRFYNADDYAVGHAYLDIYQLNPEHENRLAPMKERLDGIVDHPVLEKLGFLDKKSHSLIKSRWTWCDALYMAPPTLARMAKLSGDQKYLRFMDWEFQQTYDDLWDADEKLFYRDSRFIDQRSDNGKKIFWSRGNGWVYGGLAMIMEVLSKTDLSRPFYEKLFLDMTEGILATQQEDGLWRPSLQDPQYVNVGETSGSSFFVFGLAWGINEGLLDKATYYPYVEKAWLALQTRVKSNGKIGFVQPVGASPENNVTPDATQVYGVGAFIRGGCEILKLLGDEPKTDLVALEKEATELVEKQFSEMTAGVFYQPGRVDDLAWENDKVAFRIYGPALRDKAEDSGVDAWTKRVDAPIVRKWYEKHLSGAGSYHEDTGEGYDGYKVGGSRGCGGNALLYKGKYYTSNVWDSFKILYTDENEARFSVDYFYDIDGEKIKETKTVSLKTGSHLCLATSKFSGKKEVIDELKFVIGVALQDKKSAIKQTGSSLTAWDTLDGYRLATGVKIISGVEENTIQLLKDFGDKKDVLICGKLSGSSATYAFGYDWERFSDYGNSDAWHAAVSSFGK